MFVRFPAGQGSTFSICFGWECSGERQEFREQEMHNQP